MAVHENAEAAAVAVSLSRSCAQTERYAISGSHADDLFPPVHGSMAGSGSKAHPGTASEYTADRAHLLRLDCPGGRILQLVADGSSNAEIAERLALSQRTVQAHLRSILTSSASIPAQPQCTRPPGCSTVDEPSKFDN